MNRFILFYHMSAAVITAAFLALMCLLRWVWFDIDDVVIAATGVVMPWSFAVTIAAAGSFFYLLALAASDIAALRDGRPAFFRFGAKALPGIVLVLWGALGAVLYLETRGSVWFTPATGYTVPEALRGADGKAVDSADTWMKKRRPEIIKLFETDVYG
ncbi:MAG TPA: hypothetical protein ENN21_07720, partial [Spirochaetes bacterium]|nr:hypothetical protein [Spirochaetota bacterium]